MTIWIDLTDLLHWRGNLTGIQRIQFNLSRLYLESGKDVRFFIHNEYAKKFTEVEFEPSKLVTSGIIGGAKKDKKKEVGGYLGRAVGLVKRVRNKGVHLARKTRRALHGKVESPFSQNDTVLIVGSIWIGKFIDDLVEVKKRKGFKLIHFSFDMVPSTLPGFVVPWLPKVFNAYHKQVLEVAEGIVAISKSTASDIKVFAQKNNIKNIPVIKVVRIGDTIDDKKEKKVQGIEPGFLLSVSTIEARKNHISLFYAAQAACEKGIELPKIVIVGRKGWHTEDFRYMVKHDPVAREKIILLEDIDDAQLTWLYHQCSFTIFPSFYEGWGMPIAESLAYGKFCIASNTSSMPEIAGDLIDYFSPYDTGELLDKIVKYLDNKTLNNKEAEIKKLYKPTTWNDMFLSVDHFVEKINSN